jgi:DnaJ family protein C protein 28
MPKRYLSRRAELELEEMLSQLQSKQLQPEQHAERAAEEGVPQQRGLGAWNRLVEQRIQDAMAQGMFDNLHGMGQPLNLNDDAYVPAELRMAFRMLRSNGLAPLWIEINKEIRADIQRLYRFREHVHGRWERLNQIEYRHLRQEYETRIKEINSKILSYNIQAPSVQVHLDMLILDDELDKFDTPPQA